MHFLRLNPIHVFSVQFETGNQNVTNAQIGAIPYQRHVNPYQHLDEFILRQELQGFERVVHRDFEHRIMREHNQTITGDTCAIFGMCSLLIAAGILTYFCCAVYFLHRDRHVCPDLYSGAADSKTGRLDATGSALYHWTIYSLVLPGFCSKNDKSPEIGMMVFAILLIPVAIWGCIIIYGGGVFYGGGVCDEQKEVGGLYVIAMIQLHFQMALFLLFFIGFICWLPQSR